MKSAYLIAWLGELGGIQYLQITSEPSGTIKKAAKWPVPTVLFHAEDKTFAAASKICMDHLRVHMPEWTRFLRSPTQMRRISNAPMAGWAAAKKKT